MKGSYEVIVQNRRLQYKFTISRNITILRGDSATGKTTLIEMIRAYQLNGEQSGINISCKRKCVALEGNDWQLLLSKLNDSIVFIDEGTPVITDGAAFGSEIEGLAQLRHSKNIGIYIP